MPMTITIELSPSALALAEKFKAAPREFPQAIARSMTRSLQVVSGRIQEKRLTGHGPFPAEEHRLGERSRMLKLQTYATQAQVATTGNTSTITGAIGTSARNKGFSYPMLHEFGGKHAPERAPFRTGIRENITYIVEDIEKELSKSFQP